MSKAKVTASARLTTLEACYPMISNSGANKASLVQ